MKEDTMSKLCTSCGLYKAATTNNMESEYPKNCKVEMAFITDAPGDEEDKIGRYLVGEVGSIYNEALKRAGISRDKVFTSGVCRCHPEGNRTPAIGLHISKGMQEHGCQEIFPSKGS